MSTEPSDNLVNRTFTDPLLMVIGFLLLHDLASLFVSGVFYRDGTAPGEFSVADGNPARDYLISVTGRRMWLAIAGILILIRIGLFFPAGFLKSPARWTTRSGLALFCVVAFLSQFGFAHFWIGLSGHGTGIAALSLVSDFSIGLQEEVWFRGVAFLILLRAWGCERAQVLAAVLVSSLLFGGWHFANFFYGQDLWVTVMQVLYTSFLGIIFAVLFLITGSIWPAVIAHGFFDIGASLYALSPAVARLNGAEFSFGEAVSAYGGFVVFAAVSAVLSLRYLAAQEGRIRAEFKL